MKQQKHLPDQNGCQRSLTPEDLASSYSQLEAWKGNRKKKYAISLLKSLRMPHLKTALHLLAIIKCQRIVDPNLVNDNELFQWWANHAFENAYSQQEFEDGINMYAAALGENLPDLDAERELLGENADARIEAVDLWSQKFFPEEYQDAILSLGATAQGIQALEFLMDQMGSSSMSGNTAPIQPLNEADLQSMMKDERYWNPAKRDNAYVQKVQEGFSKLYR